jgi:hypothetical protein
MENNIQKQIEIINSKLDMLIQSSTAEANKREEREDFFADLSYIGKDFYDFSVKKLDEEKVELNDEVLTKIILKFLRDIDIFYEVLNSLENIFDLVKDLEPIVNQIGRDAIYKFSDFEQKGYFEFFREIGKLSDAVMKNFDKVNISLLTKKISVLSEISKKFLESSFLEDLLSIIVAYEEIDYSKIEPQGLFKLFRKVNGSEQIKKKIGFFIEIIEKFSIK